MATWSATVAPNQGDASKVLTAGEGGAVATDSDDLADKLKMIRNHGMVEGYDTRVLGLNLRLPELSAAVAKVQMQKLDKMLELRRRNAEMLNKLLFPSTKKHGLVLPQETRDKKFNWYLYTVGFREGRDRIKERLVKDSVGATVYYNPPVHKTPYYMQVAPGTALPATEWCADHVLSLPAHPHVSGVEVGGDRRPERTRGVEPLAAEPLLLAALQVAGGDVVGAGDAQDRAPGLAGSGALQPVAQHDRDLPFVLDPLALGRQHDQRVGTDDRGDGLEEDHRLGRDRLPALLGMIPEVEADAHDLARSGNGRAETHVGRDARGPQALAVQPGGEFDEAVAREEGFVVVGREG